VIAGVVALVVLAAGAMVVLPGSSPPNVDMTRTFPPVAANGLIVARTWKVDGRSLRTVLQVTNDTTVPTTQVLDEVIPKSIASSVRKVEFEAPAPETVKDDPVVQYKIENLAPRATVTFAYRVGVGGVTQKQLDLWAGDQARAEREHTTLAKLAVVPPQISMTVRETRKLDVQGTMQAITTVIEGWVREYPEQWLWLHRRWRSKDVRAVLKAKARAMSAQTVSDASRPTSHV
jgi:hypothetical protein